MSIMWLDKAAFTEWMANTWTFSKLLIPRLFGGVFVVGFLGRLLSEKQVAALVGDNGFTSNLVASAVGCLFYFATLTEIPINAFIFCRKIFLPILLFTFCMRSDNLRDWARFRKDYWVGVLSETWWS